MSGLLRGIDANANRASEAFRTLEDVARFVLDREDLSARAKAGRHGLREALGALPELAWHRDTAGDVGTGITTEGEARRGGVVAVAEAAGHRLAEALRVIEEFGKVLAERPGSEGLPGRVERLRYEGYDLARDVVKALGAGERVGLPWRLCLLLTEAACRLDWREVLRGALAGGVDCVQVREKGWEDGRLLERVREVVGIVHAAGAAVVVNDRVDLALLAGADGVHLGQGDLGVEEARKLAGRRLVVGVSTSRIEEAEAAERAGADYVGLGPMFVSRTKAKDRIAGPGYLKEYVAGGRLAHLAIGGITAENVGELREAGCRGIAVCAAISGADDPEAATRGLLAGLSGD
ncbi:thiamine phosphate synthase [Mucisphaera sp.]|uniref:thiamine phosphate synthase n=1 Tax=Mucisphaera sp. TaxID=2913024 RepID=UPI003D0EDF4C